MDVTMGVDAFEINMKRLLKGTADKLTHGDRDCVTPHAGRGHRQGS
jgi:hypothetical protein